MCKHPIVWHQGLEGIRVPKVVLSPFALWSLQLNVAKCCKFTRTMPCRTCLLLLMILAMDGVFVLEQPFLSWFECFPRFRSIWSRVRIVRGAFYMIHYGGPTPKRHWVYSNSRSVLGLNRGKLRGWKKNKSATAPVRHYRDAEGKKRYVGTKHLKGTGSGPECIVSPQARV